MTYSRHLRFLPGVSLLALLMPVLASPQPASTRASTLRLYLARHGQTDWNVEGRTQGGIDTELNATGRNQAQQLKSRLAAVTFDAVYASHLRRSRETAEIVHGPALVQTLTGLGERRFGKFEGRVTSDPQTGPEFQARIWNPDDALDGGESVNMFRARVQSAIDAISTKHRSGSILIVGHSYTNRMILAILLGLSSDQMRLFDQANDELYLIELESRKPLHLWKLITEANLKDL